MVCFCRWRRRFVWKWAPTRQIIKVKVACALLWIGSMSSHITSWQLASMMVIKYVLTISLFFSSNENCKNVNIFVSLCRNILRVWCFTSLPLFQVWLVCGILLASLHYWESRLPMELCPSSLTTVFMPTTRTSELWAGAKPRGVDLAIIYMKF